MELLTWLPNSLLKGVKDIPTIEIVEDTGQNYGGYYTHGSNNLVVVYNEDYPENVASTIAHEFCHHLQYENVREELPGSQFNIIDNNYELSIRHYFKKYWWEMEALLFEHKYAKSYLNDWWLRKLVLE